MCGLAWFAAYNIALGAAEQRIDAGTTVTYAIGVLAQKPAVRRLPALQVTFLACAIGAVACLPFALGLVRDVAAALTVATGWLIYLGLAPTALAFSMWAYALARMDAGRLGVTTYAVPPVTIALGAALLGETPPLLAIVGGAICLIGVGLSRRAGSSTTRTAETELGVPDKVAFRTKSKLAIDIITDAIADHTIPRGAPATRSIKGSPSALFRRQERPKPRAQPPAHHCRTHWDHPPTRTRSHPDTDARRPPASPRRHR